MQRCARISLLAAVLLAGCWGGSTPPPTARVESGPDVRRVADPGPGDGERPGDRPPGDLVTPGWTGDAVVAALPPPTRQDDYETALHEAIDHLAGGKYREALASLEKAQKINDTGTVQREIDRVRALLAEREGAEKAIADVRSVLDAGRPDEASRLAAQALSQFGGGDAAEQLTALKRQADALLATSSDDGAARKTRFREEAEAALKDNNLRAAASALEGALAAGEDADLRQRYADVTDRLTRYDQARARAQALPRDPGSAEQALAELQEAQKAWDTVPLRQEIDEWTLVLNRRRDRLAVADFEVRGDLGVPAAGRLVAEQLLPAFRPRFDLVERHRLGRVLEELKLDAGDLADNPVSRRELGRLARVRYLVLGSLTPLGGGVQVSARLVEVRTGLIVQTGTLSAPTLEALLPRLNQLGAQLLMTDEQRLAFEGQLQGTPVVVQPIEVPAEFVILPPPDAPNPAASLPAPILTYSPRPAALGGLVLADFQALPPVVVTPPPPPPLEVMLRPDDPRRRRLLALSLQLGDNLFRRGRYREAHRHYQLALQLSGGNEGVQDRLDRCQRVLPPVAVAVVAPPPRPRMAVFGLLVNCQPGLVPPAVGDWAADGLVNYLGGGYEVIDRGEACWFMGRLGITMRDLLRDPAARVCLAQALHARFFVLGTIEQTASFDVNVHLMDAQSGVRTGTARIHVQDHVEMKLRLSELVQQMGVAPAEQTRLVREGADSEKALGETRRLMREGDYARAADAARVGLKTNPDSFALQALLNEADARARQKAAEEERARSAREQAAARAEAQKRQEALLRQAAEARARAEREAQAQGEAHRAEQERRRERAAEGLRAQARKDAARGNLTGAIQALQSAQTLKPSDEGAKALAGARADQERVAREKGDVERKRAEAEQQRQREEALARLAREKTQRDQVESERRKAQEGRDQAAHTALVKQGQALMAKKEYAQALSVARQAERLRSGEDSQQLARQAEQALARAEAEKRGAAARADAEKKLLEEQKKREALAAEARQKQERYAAALQEGHKALAEKRYEQAATHFEAAKALFPTDAALTGLKQALEEGRTASRLKDLLGEGKKLEVARQYEKSAAAYREAARLAPGNAEATAGVTRLDQLLAGERQQAEFRKQLDLGRTRYAARQFEPAVAALREAVRLEPGNPEGRKALADAERALADSRKPSPPAVVDPKAKRLKEDYDLAMSAGQAAMKARNYQGAVNAYTEALRLMKDDRTALAARADAERQLGEEKKREAEAEMKTREAEFARLMAQGQASLATKKYPEAVAAYSAARKLKPADAGAAKSLADAEKALAESKKPVPPPPPPPPPKVVPKGPPAEYLKQLEAGAALEKQAKWGEAVAAYQAALRALPGDAKASAALKNAQFHQHLTAAQAAHAAKKYPDAVKEYEEALKLQPGNADAQGGLQRARAGKP